MKEKEECERSAAELDRQVAEQQAQLEQMQWNLAKVNATLGSLRSQRDLLKARLRVAEARLNLEGGRRLPRRRWLVPAAVLLGMAAAASVLWLVLPHSQSTGIQTESGEVVIETNDPNVEVVMKRGGKEVFIVDPQTNQRWQLDAAKYKLSLADQPGGLTIDLPGQQPFILRRQGEKAATVTRLAVEAAEEEITNSIGMKLKLIKPGKFLMGSPKEEEGRFDEEGPQHEVEITKAFFMGAYPVTVGQFRAFVKDSGYQTEAEKAGNKETWRDSQFSSYNQTDNDPVVYVSWNDAVKFCQWLSTKEKKTYELPTEAEWEYACRADTTTAFSFPDPKDIGDYAWYSGNSGRHTHPVGKRSPTRGACTICTATSGNGAPTGTARTKGNV